MAKKPDVQTADRTSTTVYLLAPKIRNALLEFLLRFPMKDVRGLVEIIESLPTGTTNKEDT